ncbi:adenylate/guanylate cyclase domain-containing protein [Oxynema sp. CENA135]|uniref:adenylate/guanylate cyclase domain-containing protein n=1 Tax=Oxynema sp. CENA135 TaxID=984206 RepID=UPI001F352FC7|nr:adenylate/guanylate cyclase domain-containing protein [Oxynema sp. CENA135]
MKFRSIRTRIMTTTTLLIVSIVGAIVWLWASSERELFREQTLQEAKTLTMLLSQSWSNELSDSNWNQLRLSLDSLLRHNPDFIYILISDDRANHRIIAASPMEFQDRYIPDLVPVSVTKKALQASEGSRAQDTYLLRTIEFPEGEIRARRGEPILEVASDIRLVSGSKIGTLRVGISLRRIEGAVANAVGKALLVGTFALGVGLVGAYILAKQVSDPIRRLQETVAKIAAGELNRRAEIYRADEIGALATAFNEMSSALQGSFDRLQGTIESFQRFVPEKFLVAIAPEGIENIQVGVAVKRTISILFCDIRNYTSLSEAMTPLETFSFLNDYLEIVGQEIARHGGFIDKYIGDAIMALFDDRATDGAVQAAIAMRQRLISFNQTRLERQLPPIEIGIGIHRGEVVMGTVGFVSRIESTAIGDAVNVAARVEGLTKEYGCNVLVTNAVVDSLGDREAVQLNLIDEAVKVKGKDEAIAVYEVLERTSCPESNENFFRF